MAAVAACVFCQCFPLQQQRAWVEAHQGAHYQASNIAHQYVRAHEGSMESPGLVRYGHGGDATSACLVGLYMASLRHGNRAITRLI